MSKRLLAYSATLALLISAISCSPQVSIHGTWHPIEGKSNFAAERIKFEVDGTFYFDNVKGSWLIDESGKLSLNFPNVLPNTYTYELTQTKLVLKDQVGVAGEFSRKP